MPRKVSRTDQKGSSAGPADIPSTSALKTEPTQTVVFSDSTTAAVDASSPQQQHQQSTRSKRPAESELLPESQLRLSLSSESETVAAGPADITNNTTSTSTAAQGGVIDSSLVDIPSIAASASASASASDPTSLEHSTNNNTHNEDGTTPTPTMQHSNPAHSPSESDRARLPSFSEVSGYSLRNSTAPSYHTSPPSEIRKYNINPSGPSLPSGLGQQSGSPSLAGAPRPDAPNALTAEYPSAYPQPSSPSGMPLMQGMPDPRYPPHPDWRPYQAMPGYALPPGMYAHPVGAPATDGTSASAPKPGEGSASASTSTPGAAVGTAVGTAVPFDPRNMPPYAYPMYPPGSYPYYVDAYGRQFAMHPPAFPRYEAQPEVGADGRLKRRRGNLPRHVTEILKEWFENHGSHPYPTEDEKQQLMLRTGLSISQISNWFINARRRNTNNVARNPESDAARYMPAPSTSN